MEGSTAVIGSNNKDVLMGEAYGLRAYLHFDLFRLFGPRWEDRSNINKILPYSRTTDMILNHVVMKKMCTPLPMNIWIIYWRIFVRRNGCWLLTLSCLMTLL